jgi:hypothetical protein
VPHDRAWETRSRSQSSDGFTWSPPIKSTKPDERPAEESSAWRSPRREGRRRRLGRVTIDDLRANTLVRHPLHLVRGRRELDRVDGRRAI